MYRRNRFAPLIAASTLLVALPVGCGGEDDESSGAGKKAAAPQTPAERMCKSVSDAISSCGSATPCDQALVADCADVVGLLSDSYLESTATCIEGGGVPQDCMVDALAALTPTPAHAAFGATFCETCAFGIPGCEETLFSGEGEFAVVGKLLLPFSDSLVEELAATCASSALDCPNIPQCFQGVIAQHALPENTISCVVDNITGAAPPEEASTCAAPTGDGTGTGTAGGTGTGTDGGTGTGTDGGTGTGTDGGTGTGTGGGDFAVVELDGTPMSVVGLSVWEPDADGTVRVFIDIAGPGLNEGSDVSLTLNHTGIGCDEGNSVWLRPGWPYTDAYPDQYNDDDSASCGLNIGELPAASGEFASGTFNGTLDILGDGPETVDLYLAFDIQL